MKNSPTGPLYRGGSFLRCMPHGLAGCYLCSPPAENSEAPASVALGGRKDGPGVCTLPRAAVIPMRTFDGVQVSRRSSWSIWVAV